MDPIKYFTLSMIIFILGIWGTLLNRRNILIMLMSLELMLLAVNLNFLLFSVSNIVSSKEEMILAAFFIGLFLWTWERLSPFHQKSFLLFTLLSPRAWGFVVCFLSFLFVFLLNGFMDMGAAHAMGKGDFIFNPCEDNPFFRRSREDFIEVEEVLPSPEEVPASSSAGVVDPHAHVADLPALPQEVIDLDPEQPSSSEVVVQVEGGSSSTLPKRQRIELPPLSPDKVKKFEDFFASYFEKKRKEFLDDLFKPDKKSRK